MANIPLLVKICLIAPEMHLFGMCYQYAANSQHSITGQILSHRVRITTPRNVPITMQEMVGMLPLVKSMSGWQPRKNSHHCAENGHHSIVGQWRDIVSEWQPLEPCHHSAPNDHHSINGHTISDCVAMPGPVINQQNATDGNDEACWHLYVCCRNTVA